jgi:hypothetical protein
MHFWKQCQNKSTEKETEVRARVRELELYVTHLEQYVMRNISTIVRGHYDDDRYMWAIIIRRFCDSG